MPEYFTAYIDESGEAGIAKLRSDSSTGASPYMTLGATLIRNRNAQHVRNTLQSISQEFNGKPLHCSKLNHNQLVYYCRRIREREMRLFGVISRKATLGAYRTEIAANSGKYYNKCAQYLLERIGRFMGLRKIPPENLRIVFEKANIDYGKMRNFLLVCQANPKLPQTRWLKNIDVLNIEAVKKTDEPILQVADLVAHALYRCVDKQDKNYRIPEARYLAELSERFFGHPTTDKVIDGGLHCVHKLDDLKLDPDIAELIKTMKAMPPRKPAT